MAAGLYGDLTILSALSGAKSAETEAWIAELRAVETAARATEQAELTDDRTPLHPMRVYAELTPLLDRDAIVVVDGGDFGSYAGRVIDSYVPGAWLDSGPFGCLGSGPGYALAAKLARPDRQVVLLQGDLRRIRIQRHEWDTLVRHGVRGVGDRQQRHLGPQKHPMEMLYGYSVVAELRPGTRYDEVVTALGGHGELVASPGELRPALQRAFASGLPAVVNTLTDPPSRTRLVKPRLNFPRGVRVCTRHVGEIRARVHARRARARSPSRSIGSIRSPNDRADRRSPRLSTSSDRERAQTARFSRRVAVPTLHARKQWAGRVP